MTLPAFALADSKLIRTAFDAPEFVFELKMDGFRGMAQTAGMGARLVSKNGRAMPRFDTLARAIRSELKCDAVLDGEIVTLDSTGRPRFYDLLRGRGTPLYYCFDLLWLEGEDLRNRALVVRKQILKSILPTTSASDALLYADHIEERGIDFFRLVCERDLEGIVAKKKHGVYGEAWFKIRNPVYSDYAGRRELFERRYLLRCESVTGRVV